MTTYTWPSAGKAFAPAAMTWTQRHNNRVSVSPLNGAAQTISLPGSRWGVSLDFPEQSWAERAELEGWLSRLSGQEHRVALWDLARPAPALLGGAPLVNGALTQFASTLNIDGAITPGRNLLRFTQGLDDAAWTKAGTTITANAVAAVPGSGAGINADKVVDTPTTGTHNVAQSAGAFVAGELVWFSVYLKAAEITQAMVRILAGSALATTAYVITDLSTGAAGGTSGLAAGPVITDAGSGWWRVSIGVLTSGAGSLSPAVFGVVAGNNTYTGVAGSGFYAWGWQLERGPVPTGYTGFPAVSPGDWLQLPLASGGAQLVQVVNASVGETLTGVEFRPMLRGAVADNAAVVIANPSALFILAQPELSIPRGGVGRCPPFSVEYVEVFA